MENQENIEKKDQQKLSTPMAIVVAGVLIMIGILATKGGNVTPAPKTISEQVGVSKEKFLACVEETDLDALEASISDSVDKAMSHVPLEERGTPYSIVIGKDGVKTEIRGAGQYASVKKVVDDALIGKVGVVYKGNLPEVTADEHIWGNPDAIVTIVEYSDLECVFCKQFHPVLKRIVEESNGNVRWVYRHYPITSLHQYAFEKAVASECIAKLKGNDAFWKYSDLLFGLLNPEKDSVSEKL